DMLAARLKAYLVFGPIEPAHDIASDAALEALRAAECVVAFTPYASAREYADVILPIGTFAETSGTYVNLEGRWQSVPGAATPVGEARPAWKVLRVLGTLLDLPSFEYTSSDQVTQALQSELEAASAFTPVSSARSLQAGASGAQPARQTPIYQVDAIVRRASALQNTRDGLAAAQVHESAHESAALGA